MVNKLPTFYLYLDGSVHIEYCRTCRLANVGPRIFFLCVFYHQMFLHQDSPAYRQLAAWSLPADHRLWVSFCAAVQHHSLAFNCENVDRWLLGESRQTHHNQKRCCRSRTKKIGSLADVGVRVALLCCLDLQSAILDVGAARRDSARHPPPRDGWLGMTSHVTDRKSDVVTLFDVQGSRMEWQAGWSCSEKRE